MPTWPMPTAATSFWKPSRSGAAPDWPRSVSITTTRSRGHPPLLECVLALGALAVLEDLAQGALTDVEVGLAFEVAGGHLLVLLNVHDTDLLCQLRAISVSTTASSGPSRKVVARSSHERPGGGLHEAATSWRQAVIQAARPERKNRARPRAMVGARPAPVAWARSAS